VMAQLLPGAEEEGAVAGSRAVPQDRQVAAQDQYNLEMAFSRGLYTGWLAGINNQALVHAQFGKKRGVYLGEVTHLRNEQVTVRLRAPVKPGDGVVFDSGHPEAKEEGGRIYSVDQRGQDAILTFGRHDLNLRRIQVGDRLWKTSDPELERQLRQSFAGDTPHFQRPLWLEVHGACGLPLTAIARDQQGHIVQVESVMPLVEAHTKPLTTERLQEQLGRLGNTPFRLEALTNRIEGEVLLPVSELNRLRRELVTRLEDERSHPPRWQLRPDATVADLLPRQSSLLTAHPPSLIVLVRTLAQLQAALATGISILYCEFEDPRRYREAVQQVRQFSLKDKDNAVSPPSVWVAPPRITKPGETWILQQVRSCDADGYLLRNYDHLQFFGGDRGVGDFSLNVANPLTAAYYKTQFPLERLTPSYDLNSNQLADLLRQCPPDWFEVTIHQHMPMFHMEHCVFCAFLSTGTDYTNCGRPCESHEVRLRDRTGTDHVLKADTGCRNTVFNGVAQTGAEYMQSLIALGVRYFRIEFLHESPQQVVQTINRYQQLLQGEINGAQLWRELKLQNQLGVTRGTLI